MSDGLQAFIFQSIADHLKVSAPGLAEPARNAIARSIAIKLASKLAAQHAALMEVVQAAHYVCEKIRSSGVHDNWKMLAKAIDAAQAAGIKVEDF